MATDPQDPPRHAGQVVRRVLLRRNIAIDAAGQDFRPYQPDCCRWRADARTEELAQGVEPWLNESMPSLSGEVSEGWPRA